MVPLTYCYRQWTTQLTPYMLALSDARDNLMADEGIVRVRSNFVVSERGEGAGTPANVRTKSGVDGALYVLEGSAPDMGADT